MGEAAGCSCGSPGERSKVRKDEQQVESAGEGGGRDRRQALMVGRGWLEGEC